MRATPKHCKDIIKLAKEGNILNYGTMFYSILMAFSWIYVVIGEDDQVIAYTCYAIIPGSNSAFSFQTAVAPKYRSKKIGREFLAHIEGILKKQQITTLYAHCLKPRVVNLMKKLNWKVVIKVLKIALVKKKIR